MRSDTRHRLRQDQFTAAATETVHWAVEHRQKLVWGGGIAALIAVLALGVWYYGRYRENRATEAFGRAMLTYNAPVQSEGEPAPIGKSFDSAAARSKAANAEFSAVASQYPSARSGKLARYFAAVTAMEMNDHAGAERELKSVIESSDADLASLAKLTLASLYRTTGRQADAVKLYNELIANPTRAVAKESAQLELAGLYASTQPNEARRIYEEVKKDHPQGAAGQLADMRLQALK